MTTNILRFRKPYLIQFLLSIWGSDDHPNIKRYFRNWLKLHITAPPKNYKPKSTLFLNTGEFVLELPNTYPFASKFYLSLTNQKKFEIIVRNAFYVIVDSYLSGKHFQDGIPKNIEQFTVDYNIDYEYAETIRKQYMRLRYDTKVS